MSLKKTIEFIMASIIFIVAIIEPISWVMTNIPVDNYLEFWFPVLSTFSLWCFGVYFLLKTIRYSVCIYTIIITSVYILIQTFNLIAYFTQFGLNFYNSYIFPTFLFTIVLITILKLIRCLSNRS